MVAGRIGRKGAIEIQMNWIFILIAGIVILGFFVSIINKQKSIAEDQITSSIQVNLGAILTGLRSSTDTASRVTMPNINIRFDCEGYTVGKANSIRSKTSFSPELIKGPILTAWTQEWNMPFKVTEFLYVTSPYVRYIFVEDSAGVIKRMYNEFPNRTIIDSGEEKSFFSKELISESEVSALRDKNHYKVRFIFAGNSVNPAIIDLPNFGGINKRDITAVKINIDSIQAMDGSGELVFYEAGDSTFRMIGNSAFLGKASLYGAVFTDIPETYQCNMQRALSSLNIVNGIYNTRATALKTQFQGLPVGNPLRNCQNYYTQAEAGFEGINAQTQRMYDFNVAGNIKTQANSIASRNDEALRGSCPAIY